MFNFLLETFRLGLKNLWLHKLRSLLTALGIIIGVAAVIIMVAIGEGAKRDALEQLAQLGARNIVLRSIKPPESNDASQRTQRVLEYGLRRIDLQRLEDLPDVEAIVPIRDTEQKVVRGDLRVQARAIATTPDVFDVINLHKSRGELFNWLQYQRSEPVCVLGYKAAQQLFPYEDPLEKTVRVGTPGTGTVVLTVIGVLEPTGLRAGSGSGTINRDLDMDLYFPLTLARDVFSDTIVKRESGSFERKLIEVSEIWLRAKNVADVETTARMAEYVTGIQQRSGPTDLASNERLDVEVKAPIQILRAAERTQWTFNIIMVGIAGFALVVGGIGIMNIMLASVTERTREIGIRRALGAKRRHITLQFLIETTVISLSGGLIGISIGSGLAQGLPWIVRSISDQNFPTSIAAWSVIGSFAISGLIGIVFGLYPAVMAARMNPIEALRHE